MRTHTSASMQYNELMIALPAFVTSFMKVFRDSSYEIYAVGGCVRDLIRGTIVKDWDFATNALPEDIQKLFPDSFYNNAYGTVGVPVEFNSEQHIFEVTRYRKEGLYKNNRHPEKLEWTKSVEEDLARRDFTMNSIATNGTDLVDPYDGKTDILNKVIRCVGDPDKRFQEDALRLMRAIRFTAQLGFTIEPETESAISRNAARIKTISAERIRDEFLRLLSSDHASEGVLFLKKTGLLKEILPEVDEAFTIPQQSPKRHHKYDVGTHLVQSLKHCPSSDPITRFATLIHDVGKVKTFHKDPKTSLITFYNHEVVGAKMAKKIATRFKLSKKHAEKLITLVSNHQFTVSELQTDKAIRRFIRNVGKENIQDMLDLRTGDRIGSGARPSSWRYELFKKRLEEVQHEPFAIKDLKVTGHDVMEVFAIPPGKQIGEILQKVFDEVTEKGLPNERETLLEHLKKMKKEGSGK